MRVVKKDGDGSYFSKWESFAHNSSLEHKKSRRGILESKNVREFHNHLCFLRAQGSGKVQRYQSALLFKTNEYHLSLNNSEVIINPLNGAKQVLKNSSQRHFCHYFCKTKWTICREVVAKVSYFRALEIRLLKRRMNKMKKRNANVKDCVKEPGVDRWG